MGAVCFESRLCKQEHRTKHLHLTAARPFRSAAWENLIIVYALHLPPRRR
jgi:hypothetical protein